MCLCRATRGSRSMWTACSSSPTASPNAVATLRDSSSCGKCANTSHIYERFLNSFQFVTLFCNFVQSINIWVVHFLFLLMCAAAIRERVFHVRSASAEKRVRRGTRVDWMEGACERSGAGAQVANDAWRHSDDLVSTAQRVSKLLARRLLESFDKTGGHRLHILGNGSSWRQHLNASKKF